MSSLSPLELEEINLLKSRLQDLTQVDNKFAHMYMSEDYTLWRFVLAKSNEQNSLNVSEAMFRDCVTWKKNIDMDELCMQFDKNIINTHKTACSRMGELCFYGGILPINTLRNGPVLYEKIGKVDLTGLSTDECKINYSYYIS